MIKKIKSIIHKYSKRARAWEEAERIKKEVLPAYEQEIKELEQEVNTTAQTLGQVYRLDPDFVRKKRMGMLASLGIAKLNIVSAKSAGNTEEELEFLQRLAKDTEKHFFTIKCELAKINGTMPAQTTERRQ